MEQYRDFMRSDLARYLPVLRKYMAQLNNTKAHYGYSPIGDVIMRVVNWLRADKAGDYERASYDAWFEAVGLAAQLWNEWYSVNNPLHMVAVSDDLDGLTIQEWADYVMGEWDRVQRELIAGAAMSADTTAPDGGKGRAA